MPSKAAANVASCVTSLMRLCATLLIVTARSVGAPASVSSPPWITVPLASFKWLRGTPAEYASSPTCTRFFCPGCGAQLALLTQLGPATLDVTVATLDHPQQAPADRHIWVSSRLPWLQLDPQLPQEEEERL